MSILERYANFHAKKLGANNVKIARFHWSRKSRDSCPTSSESFLKLEIAMLEIGNLTPVEFPRTILQPVSSVVKNAI